MTPADLAYVLDGTGCDAEARAIGGLHRAHCPSAEAKIALLERAAKLDARKDPQIRQRALSALSGVPRGADGRYLPSVAAKRLHALVRDAVPYVGEGVETFQSTDVTMRFGGDCDDSARALYAHAFAVGHPVKLDTLTSCRGGVCAKSHVACKLWDGREWQWAETTLRGAAFGEEPRHALRRLKSLGLAPAARPDLGALDGIDLDGPDDDTPCGAPSPEDVRARDTIVDAWGLSALQLPPVSKAGLQFVQAVARFESFYGKGWAKVQPFLADSHNWGAVQLPGSPHAELGMTRAPTAAELLATGIQCPPGSGLGFDSHADGSKYAVCFRVYPTDLPAAEDLLKTLLRGKDDSGTRRVWALVAAGETDAFKLCEGMFFQHYFGGFGKTEQERIASYAKGVAKNACAIAKAMGEPHLIRMGGSALGGAMSKTTLVLGGIALAAAGAYAYQNRAALKRALR